MNNKYITKRLEEFVEEGADLEHNRWARWHKYSRLMATPAHIEMWDRKAEMPYIALTNEEQESDRKETRNYLPLLEKAIAQAIAEERERVVREIEKIECPEKCNQGHIFEGYGGESGEDENWGACPLCVKNSSDYIPMISKKDLLASLDKEIINPKD